MGFFKTYFCDTIMTKVLAHAILLIEHWKAEKKIVINLHGFPTKSSAEQGNLFVRIYLNFEEDLI